MAQRRPEHDGPGVTRASPSPGGRARARLIVAAPVAAGHLLLFMMLATPPSQPWTPPAPADPPLTTVLMTPPPPPPPPPPVVRTDLPGGAPAAAAPSSTVRPAPAPSLIPVRPPRRPPPPDGPSRSAVAPSAEPGVILGEAALAGALVAGAGDGEGGAGRGDGRGPGGGCDMIRRLQDALRADPDIRAAVTRSHQSLGPGARAILVWNGEWLRSSGQDGKGLAGVRQAIAMEVAFAPDACRAQRMRGLAVIAFGDGPAAPRLALGGGDWQWSDLLSARR